VHEASDEDLVKQAQEALTTLQTGITTMVEALKLSSACLMGVYTGQIDPHDERVRQAAESILSATDLITDRRS
jgi:hypothetical protein